MDSDAVEALVLHALRLHTTKRTLLHIPFGNYLLISWISQEQLRG